jgi:PhnB protein
MLKANIHLHFDGRCKEALEFYSAGLGGKVTYSLTWGESPAAKDAPPGWADKILHAGFEFHGQVLSADDAPPGISAPPQGFEIAVSSPDVEAARKVFQALAQGGTIRMPFAKTFWSPGFGMVTDRFGVPWTVNCPRQDSRQVQSIEPSFL